MELTELRLFPQDPNRQHATATQQREPEIRQHEGLLTELSNSLVSAVQSKCECVNGCSVVNVFIVGLFPFQKSKFLPVTAFCLILKKSANCGPGRYVNPPVWLVFRQHINKVSEFVYRKREKICILVFRETLGCNTSMAHNKNSKVQFGSHLYFNGITHNTTCTLQIESNQLCTAITYTIMAYCKIA